LANDSHAGFTYLSLLGINDSDRCLVNAIASALFVANGLTESSIRAPYTSSRPSERRNKSLDLLNELSDASLAADYEQVKRILSHATLSSEAASFLHLKTKLICEFFEANPVHSLLAEDIAYWEYCRSLLDGAQNSFLALKVSSLL